VVVRIFNLLLTILLKELIIMSNDMSKVMDRVSALFQATEDCLSAWQGEGNMQFPTLMTIMSERLGWTEKQAREADPVIRYYIRNSENWYVTRGAKGGIMRASDRQKKQEALASKENLKKQMKAKIEAQTTAAQTTNQDSVNNSDSEDLFDDSLDD
jgi:hypothetical protein